MPSGQSDDGLKKHMKQDSAMKLCDDGADATVGARAERLAGPNRRAQVLRTASAQFAMTGLHGTTTLTLAKAAGISEAILFYTSTSETRPSSSERPSKSIARPS